jgi:hypothetical protein
MTLISKRTKSPEHSSPWFCTKTDAKGQFHRSVSAKFAGMWASGWSRWAYRPDLQWPGPPILAPPTVPLGLFALSPAGCSGRVLAAPIALLRPNSTLAFHPALASQHPSKSQKYCHYYLRDIRLARCSLGRSLGLPNLSLLTVSQRQMSRAYKRRWSIEAYPCFGSRFTFASGANKSIITSGAIEMRRKRLPFLCF